jgi:N-acetylneuraminate synthase
MAALGPDHLKVPSASNTNVEMLSYLCDHFGGEIHVSLGMTTRAEEDSLIHLFDERGRLGDLVLYACTAGYPVPFEDLHLYEISRLRQTYGHRVKAIGFSGHHLGIAADMAAVTLGAEWIERHFTLDRTWKGTDHAASLEPDGVRRLVRDVTAVTKALSYKPQELLDIEQPQREKMKWTTPPTTASTP